MFALNRTAPIVVAIASFVTVAVIAFSVALAPNVTALPEIKALRLEVLVPTVALGILGLVLATRTRMVSSQSSRRSHLYILIAVATGIAFGVVGFAIDVAVGSASLVAMRDFGLPTAALSPLPMLYDCAAVTVLTETIYRFVPMSVAYWLIAHHIFAGRAEPAVFWSVGAATSLIEPIAFVVSVSGPHDWLWTILASLLALNLSETTLWRHFGWTAPLLARFSYYAMTQAVLLPLM